MLFNPKDARVYSLLGHIYAVQGEIKLAKNAFKKADALSPKPLWLDFNKALLAIKQKHYKEAARLFRKNTLHNIKQNKADPYLLARNNVYKSSWDIWKRMSLDYPQLDVMPSVRKGLMKRVLPDQLSRFLKGRKKTDKPVFVHFSSSDDFCQPCLKSNQSMEKLAQELKEYYDFVLVSFESWNLVKYYENLVKPEKIRALPAQAVFHGTRLVAYQPGHICLNFPCKTTMQMLIKLSKKK
jgi:tetratricopeptide (TPR) repeat protein